MQPTISDVPPRSPTLFFSPTSSLVTLDIPSGSALPALGDWALEAGRVSLAIEDISPCKEDDHKSSYSQVVQADD